MGGTVSPVKIEENGPVKRQLTFEIPWANVAKELDVAYRKIGKTAKIKGFRAGKTPRKVLEVYYSDQAEGEAVSTLVTRYYSDAVKENGIMPVDNPTIDQKGIETNKDFQFTATVEVEPVIEVKDYLGLKIEKGDINVTASDVTDRIEQIRQMYSTLEEVKEDRAIKEGDFVTIDFTGKVDEKVQKKLSSEDYTLQIGSKVLFADFEEQLIGVQKGEEKKVAVTFPEKFHMDKVAGKEGVFTVNIKDIRERILPKLDNNFVKNFEKYETIKDLEEDVKKSIEEEEKTKVKAEVENQVIERLLEKNDFEVPSIFVERQIYMMMLNAQKHLVNNGMKPEEAFKISSNMHDSFKNQAEKTVKASILLSKIAEKESIACDEKELEERLKEIGSGIEASKKDNLKEGIRDEIVNQKTLDYVVENADIKTGPKKKGKKEAK